MLYSIAILKRSEDVVEPDELIYGPVMFPSSRCEDTTTVAHRVIAQAAAEGKLPGGWTSRHYVAGVAYSQFS